MNFDIKSNDLKSEIVDLFYLNKVTNWEKQEYLVIENSKFRKIWFCINFMVYYPILM